LTSTKAGSDIHPQKCFDQQFYEMPANATVDDGAAKHSIQKLCRFDGNNDMLMMVGHDASLTGKIDLFPANVNKIGKLKEWRINYTGAFSAIWQQYKGLKQA
jgi:hypothetical protein